MAYPPGGLDDKLFQCLACRAGRRAWRNLRLSKLAVALDSVLHAESLHVVSI